MSCEWPRREKPRLKSSNDSPPKGAAVPEVKNFEKQMKVQLGGVGFCVFCFVELRHPSQNPERMWGFLAGVT